MTLLGLSLAYLRDRPLNAALNLLLLALGVGTIVLLILFSARLEERLTRDARGIDLVIGAKGSPLQLILASIYHVDVPTGNVPLAEVARWRRHPLVEAVIPIALGDNVAGFRVVGTEPAYVEHYGAALAAGRLWQEPFEATIGATVAARTGLGVGGTFVGSHGLAPGGPAHTEDVYTVVGVLAPNASVLDRLILTPIDTVWQVHGFESAEHDETDDHGASAKPGHEHEESAEARGAEPAPATDPDHAGEVAAGNQLEVTALLVRYRSPLAAVELPRLVNQETAFQAAAPALEMTRLLSLIGVGLDTLRAFGLLLIASAGLSVFIALWNALEERRYDLALLRTLGAPRRVLFLQPLLEGVLLTGGGALLGVGLGHGVAEALGRLVPAAEAIGLAGLAWQLEEVYAVGLALGVGALAALLPAVRAYRTDIADILASRA